MRITRKRMIVGTVGMVILTVAVAVTVLAVHKNIHRWGPRYLVSLIDRSNGVYKDHLTEHVMFCLVDHHEHPFEEAAAKASAIEWGRDYRSAIENVTDDYGNVFQYTWFYPYDDQRTPTALVEISRLVYEGYGEIEFHWHNSHVSNADYADKLTEAVAWFNEFGAMKTIGPESRNAFGYVSGNWDLDNARRTKEGPSREIDALQQAGSYADFTFPNGSVSQPGFFSALYYVVDDDEPQSYLSGTPAVVGRPCDDYLIFQGPTSIDVAKRTVEFGTVEDWWRGDWRHRAETWVKNAPYVEGRPEWRFIKLYTHGVQSRRLTTSSDLEEMLTAVKTYYADRDVSLHFVTAREAFNIVKAAEAGLTGDPELYRDFRIAPYVNSFVHVSRPVEMVSCNQGEVEVVVGDVSGVITISVRSPAVQLTGEIESVNIFRMEEPAAAVVVALAGVGAIDVETDTELDIQTTGRVEETGTGYTVLMPASIRTE